MDNKTPLFTIITVTFNAEKTIERTLLSIASQSFKDFEHLIIDGKSSDSTLDIIEAASGKDLRKVVSEPDYGLYDAMNKGIGIARGKYLIFLNAGDKFHSPHTLELIAKKIKENDSPGVVYGQTDLVDDEGKFIAKRHLTAPDKLSIDDFKNGMVVCHQAFIVQRRIAPYFSLKYRFSADYEWCIICLMHSKNNVYTGQVLIDYLVTGISTENRRKSLIERFKIMSTYYGFFPALFRHFGFIGRFIKHQKQLKKNK